MHGEIDWDDRLWQQVWERNLTQPERHAIGMAVLRGTEPRDPFEAQVALELARRWRRHALWLTLLYAVWCLFWTAVGWDAARRYGLDVIGLPATCAALGLIAVTGCLMFRRRMHLHRERFAAVPRRLAAGG